MRPKWVMYAWAGAQHCGLAPVDVGPVLQDLSTGTDLSLFSGLSPLLRSFYIFFSHSTLSAILCSSYPHV